MLYEMRIVSYTEAEDAADAEDAVDADAEDFLKSLITSSFLAQSCSSLDRWCVMGLDNRFFFLLANFFDFFFANEAENEKFTRFCSMDVHMIPQVPDKIRAVLQNIGRLAAI